MPPIDVPVFYGNMPVPGVMAQINQIPNGVWIPTADHYFQRDHAISAAIRAMAGIGPAQNVTIYEISPGGVRYRIAVPRHQAAGAGAGGQVVAPPVNIYAGAPHVGELDIPADATSPIGMNLPPAGTEMANFHGELGFGRVYTREEFNALEKKYQHGYRKENPSTRQVIRPENVRYYRSRGGKSRRRRRSGRKTHRRRRA